MTSFLIMTSFATELATLSVTDERTLRTDTLLRLIYKYIILGYKFNYKFNWDSSVSQSVTS